MTQFDFFIAATDTGSDLAMRLNQWRDALRSNHRGALRPDYAVAGMLWVKDVGGTPPIDEIYLFDGVNDVLIGAIDRDTHIFTPAGARFDALDVDILPDADDQRGLGSAAARFASGHFARLYGAQPTLHVRDEKGNDVNGGAFSPGAWERRDLNTVVANTIGGASLASNVVTLPPGEYVLQAEAPAYIVKRHQTRMFDLTAGVALLLDSAAFTNTGSNTATTSTVFGRFALNVQSDIVLEHRCETRNSSSNGRGVGSRFGNSVFSTAIITQIREGV